MELFTKKKGKDTNRDTSFEQKTVNYPSLKGVLFQIF